MPRKMSWWILGSSTWPRRCTREAKPEGACFPDGSWEARHVRRATRNEFRPRVMLELKFTSERERPEDVPEVDRLAAKAYSDRTPRNLLYRLIYKHTPRVAFRAAQTANRAARAVATSIRTRRRREPLAAAR